MTWRDLDSGEVQYFKLSPEVRPLSCHATKETLPEGSKGRNLLVCIWGKGVRALIFSGRPVQYFKISPGVCVQSRCEDRVLDGPASGGKGSKGGN